MKRYRISIPCFVVDIDQEHAKEAEGRLDVLVSAHSNVEAVAKLQKNLGLATRLAQATELAFPQETGK